MHVTIAAIAKNEGRYIAEWLAHHFSLGVDGIVVYNNESSDETGSILDLASKCFPLKHQVWETHEGVSPQMSAYNDILQKYTSITDAIAFIDIDEFIIPTSNLSLNEVIQSACEACPNAGAISVNQRVFGSNNLEKYIPDPVLKRFPLCSAVDYPENRWFKSIYFTNRVKNITNCHSSELVSGIYTNPTGIPTKMSGVPHGESEGVDFSKLQLNHYITKSLEEFRWKQSRGGGAGATFKARLDRYADDAFFTGRQAGLNTTTDAATEVYVEKIEKAMNEFDLRIRTQVLAMK